MSFSNTVEAIKQELTKLSNCATNNKIKNNIESNLSILEVLYSREIIKLKDDLIETQQKLSTTNDMREKKLSKIIEQSMTNEGSRNTTKNRTFPVVVHAKQQDDNIMSSESIETFLKKNLEVGSLGLGIAGIKKTKYNKIIVSCTTGNDAKLLETIINEKFHSDLTAEMLKKKTPWILIKNIDAEYNQENLTNDLLGQNADIAALANIHKENKFTVRKRFEPKTQLRSIS
jgi:hypothetical protein